MIPKKIHYCWFGEGKMSPLQRACVATWAKKLPQYEFFLWNESNVDIEDPLISHFLKLKQWAFVSDYIRLLQVFEHGGVYLDTDVEVIASFDPLLNHKSFFGRESCNYLNSAVFGAEKNNSFVWECISFMKSSFGRGKPVLSAPDVITQCYSYFDEKESVFICPVEAFYPYNPYVSEVKQLMYEDVKDATFAIHHWAKTWEFTLLQKIKRAILGVR